MPKRTPWVKTICHAVSAQLAKITANIMVDMPAMTIIRRYFAGFGNTWNKIPSSMSWIPGASKGKTIEPGCFAASPVDRNVWNTGKACGKPAIPGQPYIRLRNYPCISIEKPTPNDDEHRKCACDITPCAKPLVSWLQGHYICRFVEVSELQRVSGCILDRRRRRWISGWLFGIQPYLVGCHVSALRRPSWILVLTLQWRVLQWRVCSWHGKARTCFSKACVEDFFSRCLRPCQINLDRAIHVHLLDERADYFVRLRFYEWSNHRVCETSLSVYPRRAADAWHMDEGVYRIIACHIHAPTHVPRGSWASRIYQKGLRLALFHESCDTRVDPQMQLPNLHSFLRTSRIWTTTTANQRYIILISN